MVTGNPTKERMPDDWIGPFTPFFPKEIPHSVIIDSLLMSGNGEVIPFGKIYGITRDSPISATNTIYKIDMVPVGQEDSNEFKRHK